MSVRGPVFDGGSHGLLSLDSTSSQLLLFHQQPDLLTGEPHCPQYLGTLGWKPQG